MDNKYVWLLVVLIGIIPNVVDADIAILMANSTGGSGDYSLMASENLYNNGYLFAAQGTPTIMNASGLTYVSANDSKYIKLAGSSSKDSRWRNNFTLSNVQSVQWINTTGIINTAASDTTHMGIKNVTGYQKLNWTNAVGTNRYAKLSINVSGSNTSHYDLTGNTLTFSVSLWTNGGSSNTHTRLDMMQASVTYTPAAADTSFTVTLPVGYTDMTFHPLNNNSKNIVPDGSGIANNTPWATIGNSGTVALTFTVNTTAAQPSWVDVSISNNTAMSGNFSLSNTAQSATGWTNIAVGDEARLFANGNFTAAAVGTTQRTLEVNSQQS